MACPFSLVVPLLRLWMLTADIILLAHFSRTHYPRALRYKTLSPGFMLFHSFHLYYFKLDFIFVGVFILFLSIILSSIWETFRYLNSVSGHWLADPVSSSSWIVFCFLLYFPLTIKNNEQRNTNRKHSYSCTQSAKLWMIWRTSFRFSWAHHFSSV